MAEDENPDDNELNNNPFILTLEKAVGEFSFVDNR